MRRRGAPAKKYEASFSSDQNALKVIEMMVTQLRGYPFSLPGIFFLLRSLLKYAELFLTTRFKLAPFAAHPSLLLHLL